MPSPHILVHLPYLSALADIGSFTLAAQHMNITQAAMSYQIKQLETKLDNTLVIRGSGSRLSLTSAGKALVCEYQHCAKRLSLVINSLNHTKGLGELRISASVDFGSLVMPKVLMILKQMAPALSVKLHVSDDVVDLTTSDWDMAIRSKNLDTIHLEDSPPLYSSPLYMVASPAYLAGTGAPKRPKDLLQHTLLIRGDSKHKSWSKVLKEHALEINQIDSTYALGSTIAIREAAREGLGLALLPEFMVKDYLDLGLLVPILASFTKTHHVDFHLARLQLPQLASHEKLLREVFSLYN